MRFLCLILCLSMLTIPAAALEIEAPIVPKSGREWMPQETESLEEGIAELIRKVISALRPDLKEAVQTSTGIIAATLMVSLLQSFSEHVHSAAQTAGAVAVAATLLLSTNSMIRLASDTVQEISNYGMLLLPVMTAALAAQGGVTASASLYSGTALFNAILGGIMGNVLVPGIYLFQTLSIGFCVTGENLLKKSAELLKGFMSWCLKILLMVFTTYLSMTGVVSGTTDAAVLKATRVSISSFIPVVGGILSDASEAVLVSAGLMKNAAGIYGILAVLALFLYPFLQISLHYLILKLTAAVSSLFSSNPIAVMIDSFSTAMGFLLGLTGASCVIVLISTVCYMKGVG